MESDRKLLNNEELQYKEQFLNLLELCVKEL